MEENTNYISRSNADAYIPQFLADIEADNGETAIKTGFEKLDSIIGGGLYAGLYCVGAISSLGKTTFVLQMADQIAMNGKDVLIISLEMAKREMIAKSISRRYFETYKDTDCEITTRNILSCTYPKENKNKLLSTINDYRTYAKNIYIVEGQGNISTNTLRKIMNRHKEETKNIPVLIIDYLQLLSPAKDKSNDKMNMDDSVKALKHISRDFNTPVITISSFSRAAYTKDAAMSSFKESGNIEYSADVLISLQYPLQNNKTTEQDQLKQKGKDNVDIELIVLKSRNSQPGNSVKFKFMPKFNYFHAIDK